MIVSDFTTPELRYLRENCNFVGKELKIFELRSQGISLEDIAEMLDMTVEGTKYISRKVTSKIKRVI